MVIRISQTLALLFLTLCSGCGETVTPAASVAGKVTLNGKPFTGAAVHFYNPKVGGGAFNLNENGEFSSSQPLPVAEYLVSLDRPGPSQGTDPSDIVWPEDKSGEVPVKYRSGVKSGLVARVVEGDQNHFVFEMTGKPPSGKGKGQEGPTAFEPLPGVTG